MKWRIRSMKVYPSWGTFEAENEMNKALQAVLADGWEPFAVSGGGSFSDTFMWFRKPDGL